MRIRVFASDSNPSIDSHFLRKSVVYCEREIAEGRAFAVNPDDITAGIKLLPSEEIARNNQTERRGSPEKSGCLTANESELNACYRGDSRVDHVVSEGRACFVPDVEVPLLAHKYEERLEKHIAKGRKGSPLACAIIAAKVKTILSDPAQSEVRRTVTA